MTTAPTLFIVTGISFSGRSVLAREIQEWLGVQRIDLDELGHDFGLGLNGELLSDAQWARIHSESRRRARALLAAGHSLV